MNYYYSVACVRCGAEYMQSYLVPPVFNCAGCSKIIMEEKIKEQTSLLLAEEKQKTSYYLENCFL